MAAGTKDKYYVRRPDENEWSEITATFQGVHILSLDGTNSVGDSVNIFTQQWVDSQTEDFMVTTQDGQGHDVSIRKNVDLQLTFICGQRYGAMDTQQVHDNFIDYVTKHGDFYIKSKYTGKEAHVVCLKGYKPTTQKLQRGVMGSYIMGTIELHTLEMPQTSLPEPTLGDLYIGFGGSSLGNMTNVNNLANKQHFNVSSAVGDYEIVCPKSSTLYRVYTTQEGDNPKRLGLYEKDNSTNTYTLTQDTSVVPNKTYYYWDAHLWICFTGTIGMVKANGFEVPMIQSTSLGDLRCYRTYNAIVPHTMNFSITQEI